MSPSKSSRLLFGTASVSITPAIGCQMVHRTATGIHDGLYAPALALELDGTRAAIVGLDLISLARSQVWAIRRRAKALCGIEPDGLMLCCSHTHSGPTTNDFRGWGAGDPVYVDHMIEKIAQCIADAFANLSPGSLAYGEWPLQIGFNRRLDYESGPPIMTRNPDGPVDRRIRVLKVSAPGKHAPCALLFSHGCHPVIIHRSTRMVSADYPGRAREHIVEQMGPGVFPLFAQGCGADANTEVLNGTFDDLDRIGQLVGWAAVEAARHAQPIPCDRIRPALQTVSMPTRMPTRAEAQKALQLNNAELRKIRRQHPGTEYLKEFEEYGVRWAEDLLAVAETPDVDHRIRMDVMSLALGDRLCLVGLEAEVFHRYHDICAAVSPYPNNIVLGGVNGSVNYLPTADEFARGGYEVGDKSYVDTGAWAFKRYATLAFTPECESTVRHAVREMLRKGSS